MLVGKTGKEQAHGAMCVMMGTAQSTVAELERSTQSIYKGSGKLPKGRNN